MSCLNELYIDDLLATDNGKAKINANSLRVALNCIEDCLHLGSDPKKSDPIKSDPTIDYLIQAKSFAKKENNYDMIANIDEILTLKDTIDYLIQAKSFAEKEQNYKMITNIDEILTLEGTDQCKKIHYFIEKYKNIN